MLSGVLNSPLAIRANVEIMRTFVRLRQFIAANIDLAKKLDALERRYDSQFKLVFDAIRENMNPTKPLCVAELDSVGTRRHNGKNDG